jgi:hypothetical protein
MDSPYSPPIPTLAEVACWTPERIVEQARENADLQHRIQTIEQQLQTLKQQLDWFKRQLFGQKSEKRLIEPNPAQMSLGELSVPEALPEAAVQPVAAHTRRRSHTDFTQDKDDKDGSALFFDESRVPVETIAVPNPETEGLTPDQYEVISEKVTHRLAQRPGNYVVLKYVRPVIKRLDTQTIHCPPAPMGVIEGSRADVSFLAGLLIDKFAWHLPLYRPSISA